MRKFLGVLVSLFVLGIILSYLGYHWIMSPNTLLEEPYEFYIHSGQGYEDVKTNLMDEGVLKNPQSFDLVAQLMKYDKDKVPPGRYIVQPNSSNRQIIGMLRLGMQSPVSVVVSQARTIYEIAATVSQRIEPDSAELVAAFHDTEKNEELGFNDTTVLAMIVPNTYEFFWDTNAAAFYDRMKKEHDEFWTSERKNKADQKGLTPLECSILASIVEKESNIKSERPTIAGVYLNRLEQGILLQADPTVVFGLGEFGIRRVLNRHLDQDTPYNTYMHPGLPPGPICMPSISSIDAVLNAEEHDYIFFCAKPGYNGAHAFAETNGQHEQNARIYRQWLDSEQIRS